MLTDEQTVSLDTICGGGLIMRFNDELTQVIANCLDPNTGDGVRQITMTVKVKPDASRNLCHVSASVMGKLLPSAPLSTSMFIGMDPKLGPVAYENNPRQMNLFGAAQAEVSKISEMGANVVPFKGAQNA